jgi:uncharacterized protein YjdB
MLCLVLTLLMQVTASAQNWKLIQPTYPRTDAFVAAFSVADYGANGDGVTDVTSIFQARLNALGNLGGGTLFVPKGKYVIRGTLEIPKGITLRGEWQKPVKGDSIRGTILMAYSGRGNNSGTPFISMQPSAGIRDIAIWYPEQLPDNITPYPPAIVFGVPNYFGNDFCNAKNITFVNAYEGAIFSRVNGGSSPVIYDIYGTPLLTGIEIDNIADVGRIEQVDFSPAYWAGSGLPNSPAAGSGYASWIKQNGTGIMMRRNDWSYSSYVSVEGYNVGFRSAVSIGSPGATPNGHNYAMTFTNCQTGVYFDVLNNVGIMFARVNTVNCTNGFVVGPNANGVVQLHTCNIGATQNAIATDATANVQFLTQQCTINSGKVNIAGGTFTASDCDFNNAAPQVTLGSNSRGIITGNRFKNTAKIENNSLYVSVIDSTPLTLKKLPAFPVITTESHMPTRQALYVVSNNATDNTAGIQNALNQASADGGGIVFLPPGKYKVLGNLSVPSNVELKGSVDNSTVPMGPGSILEVYAGKGNATGTPFLKLAARSGVQGITFDYPEQLASLAPNFLAYPYTIQATGSDVYIVNIGIRAAYNGIDLFTNKCDNHYVDYLAGHVFKNAIRVGGNSNGGKIYNLQFNTIVYAAGSESKFGSWPNSPVGDNSAVYDYQFDNLDFLILGNCQNETLYNDFVFGARNGIHLIPDGATGPSGISLGLGIDGARNSMNFEAIGAAGLDFINTQTVAFATDTTTSYMVTSPTFTTQTTLFNSDYWGNPGNSILLNGGTVNLQTANFAQPGQLRWARIQTGALNTHNSAIQPVNALLNAGAETKFSAHSSILDSSNIHPKTWKDNLGNIWTVSVKGAMDRKGWTATGSVNNGNSQNALDSNATTRWDTQGGQVNGQSFIVDMKTRNTIHEIVLDASQSPSDSPAGYAVYTSLDGINWGNTIATGIGATGMTMINFADQKGRYIKIVQTGSKGNYWSIHEFYVFGKVDVTNVTITPKVTSLNVDSTKKLTATVAPVNATNKNITWASDNTAIATVDANGLVTAINGGTVIIKAISQDEGVTAYDTIQVTGGTTANIPGKIEAEDYDNGGQGVAYNDIDATNNGGQYRPTEGVDVEACGDGGYDVGYTSGGEWIKYAVNVNTAGVYTLQVRVASPYGGKTMHVELDGVNISGSISIPNTTGWQTYQTLSVTTPSLGAGRKVMRIVMDTDGFNIDYVNFVSVSGAKLANDIVVYPNPVTGSQINMQFSKQGNYQVRLINYQYQAVYNTAVNITSNNGFYSLSLNKKLLPGVYFLEATNKTGERVVKKISVVKE